MGISLACILLTQWHGDHTGDVPDLLRMFPSLEHSVYKNDPDLGQQGIVDGQTWQVDRASVQAIHLPGHSHDHMCFILAEEQAIFTGDNVLGSGTSAVEDLSTFMQSLVRMRDQRCFVAYPAHGATIFDLPTKLD